MISLNSQNNNRSYLILSLNQYVDMPHRILIRKNKIQKVFVNSNKEWMYYERLFTRLVARKKLWGHGLSLGQFMPMTHYPRALIFPPLHTEYRRGLEIRFFKLPLMLTPALTKYWNKYPAMKLLFAQEHALIIRGIQGFWMEPGIRKVFQQIKHVLPDPIRQEAETKG